MGKVKDFLSTNKIFFSIAWKKHKSYYFLYIVSIFYSVANNMILVYLPKLSLEAFLEKNNFPLGVIHIVGSILISVIWSYFERKIAVIQSLNVTDIALEMRNKLYKKIIANNLLAYEDCDQYNALLKALNYTDVGADQVVNVLARLLSCIFTMIGVSYVIGKISIVMVFIILASLFLAHLCMSKVNKLWFEYQNSERLPKVRLINYLSGLFNDKHYVAEIKLNNAFEFATEVLKNKKVKLAQESAKKDMQRFKWNYLAIIINNFQLFAAYVYFGYLLFSKSITIATYSSLFTAVQQFSSSFGSLLGIIIEMSNKISEASYYMTYLLSDKYVQKGNENINHVEKIEFKDVSFTYPNQLQNALNKISLSIKAGEKIAVVGENGAGKSTLLKVLLGLYPPSSGEVVINDALNLHEANLSSWYDQIAVVMQNSVHIPLTLKEDIALRQYDSINAEQLKNSIAFSGLEDKIKNLKKKENSILSTQFEKEGVDFSGGEKQKLSIARAFYRSTNILVFDEPSSSLDPNAEYDFFQKVYDLGKNKTVIFVSHRLSTVIKADKIIVLEKGKIVEYGTHSELMAIGGAYSKMYNKQTSNYLGG